MCESAPSIVIVRHDFRPLRKVRSHHLVTEPLSCGVTTWQCHPSQPKLTSQPFRKGDKNVQTLQLNPICFLAHPQNPHEPNFGKGVFLPTKKNTKTWGFKHLGGFQNATSRGLGPTFFHDSKVLEMCWKTLPLRSSPWKLGCMTLVPSWCGVFFF